MKAYAIAKMERECVGHGAFRDVPVLEHCPINGVFARVYTDRKIAEYWMNQRGGQNRKIIELEVIDTHTLVQTNVLNNIIIK